MEAYPLYWPADYPRSRDIKKSRFKTTLGMARDFVKHEIERLKATNPIISTNIPLKDNGDLRADWTRFRIDDAGVAVYFTRKNQQVVLCCDTYTRVWDNLHAIGRTIEALRQIDRDGVSDFLDRSFTGFKALPETIDSVACFTTLGISPASTLEEIKSAYKDQAFKVHPDKGGDDGKFSELHQAYLTALKIKHTSK